VRLGSVFLIAVGVSACADDIVAPPPAEANFTIWGSLNPDSTAQAIRVVPVLPIINGERPEPLDASVMMTDLETGETVAWQDSVVTYPRGRIGHVFHTAAAIPYGSRQLVRVVRSDGAETTATVQIPSIIAPIVEEPVLTSPVRFEVDVTMPTYWPQASHLDILSVSYDLVVGDVCEHISITEPGANRSIVSEADGGLRIDFSLDRAVESGWFTANSVNGFGVGPKGYGVLGITLEVLVSGIDARPPGGTYNPALFFAPGQFSNVEDGFGLVVGAYKQTVSWVPDRQLTTHAGFGGRFGCE